MYRLLLLLLLVISFTSCKMGDESMDIVHSIKVYQFDIPNHTLSGDCEGTVGVILADDDKFRIDIDVESVDGDFGFDMNLAVETVSSTREKLAGDLYKGSKYICYDDTTKYVISLVYPEDLTKPGGIFWIIDWDDNSILLLTKERIK